MQRISAAEVQFIEGGVAQNVRADGRARLDYRYVELETGLISHANGSARVKVSGTDVLVGVKVEIGEPEALAPSQGRIHFGVRCSPTASPEYEGNGAEVVNLELARAMSRLVGNSGLDLSQLAIIPGKQCWVVYVDALVLDSAGNLCDAIAIATRAALSVTKIPKVELVQSESGETEMEVSDDPEDCTTLSADTIPVCVTLTKIGQHYIVDATTEEELCMGARLTVGVTPKGNVCALQKSGKGGLPPSLLNDMVQCAQKIGMTIIAKMGKALELDADAARRKVGFL
eukprot:m51a1_g14511 putative exosome component 7 (286) ;mRNA; f:831227-832719